MGDKDKIPESLLGEWQPFMRGDRLITPDNQDVPVQTIRPLKDRMPSFNFDIPKEDMEQFRKMLEEPLFKDDDPLPIARLKQEMERQGMTLIIECEPTVNKPKNLKYPHKRRKKRILKKWAKRFGTTPNQLVVPDTEVEWGMAPNEEGILCHHFRIKPKKQP